METPRALPWPSKRGRLDAGRFCPGAGSDRPGQRQSGQPERGGVGEIGPKCWRRRRQSERSRTRGEDQHAALPTRYGAAAHAPAGMSRPEIRPKGTVSGAAAWGWEGRARGLVWARIPRRLLGGLVEGLLARLDPLPEGLDFLGRAVTPGRPTEGPAGSVGKRHQVP